MSRGGDGVSLCLTFYDEVEDEHLRVGLQPRGTPDLLGVGVPVKSLPLGKDVEEGRETMERCGCGGLPGDEEITLTLECLDCEGGVVKCRHCGKPEWWSDAKRRFALNAAEAHRWETGHTRVVVRGFGGKYAGQVVMEVGDE